MITPAHGDNKDWVEMKNPGIQTVPLERPHELACWR